MNAKFGENNILLSGVRCLDLDLTLDCGQAFCWDKEEDGSWSGIAGGKYLNIKNTPEGFLLTGATKDDYENFWKQYFDLDRDYVSICDRLKSDSLLSKTVDDYYGIRILRQDSWEALCTFVISQNNNIKRIKKITQALSKEYGEKIGDYGWAFPSAEKLAELSESDFASLGAGYRASYLEQLSKGVAEGRIDLEAIKGMSLEEAREELMKIKGVGRKVADCALLFGFGFLEAFPIDVWMKRVMEYYPDGLPECFSGYQGVAQQYLFHWARHNL